MRHRLSLWLVLLTLCAGVTVIAQTVIFSDAFTDTNGVDLSLHTPTGGTSWAIVSGGSNEAEIQTNRVEMINHFSTARYAATPASSSANYYVQTVLNHNIQSGWAGHNAGVWGRAAYPGGGTMILTSGYEAKWLEVDNTAGTAGEWRLTSWSGGTESAALGTYADAWTSGTRTVRLTMNGTSIVVAVDGVNRISVTNSAHSTAGAHGLVTMGGLKDGIRLDDFESSTLASVGGSTKQLLLQNIGLN
jgi:hypothetical protein